MTSADIAKATDAELRARADELDSKPCGAIAGAWSGWFDRETSMIFDELSERRLAERDRAEVTFQRRAARTSTRTLRARRVQLAQQLRAGVAPAIAQLEADVIDDELAVRTLDCDDASSGLGNAQPAGGR